MASSSRDYTRILKNNQDEQAAWERFAIYLAQSVEAQKKKESRFANENGGTNEDIELVDLAKGSPSQSLILDSIYESMSVENTQDTLIAVADKPDVLVWTFARLWDVFSNIIANGTNADTPNPNSSFSDIFYQDPLHTDQGLNPIGDVVLGAGVASLLIGVATRIYRLHRERVYNSYDYMLERFNQMSNGYKEQFELHDLEAYHYSKDDIIKGMNEILKHVSLEVPKHLPDAAKSPHNDYFEPNQFVKTFNWITETSPIQVLGSAWDFLSVQSLWFWVIWFPAYLAAGAAITAVLPIVLITLGVVAGLHLTQRLVSFIYKKAKGIDELEIQKKAEVEAEEKLQLKKLKILWYTQEEHKVLIDILKRQYDVDDGTYDFCVVSPHETSFLDDLDHDQSFNYLETLDDYLNHKPLRSLSEHDLPDEEVKTGKLYLQKVYLNKIQREDESCIAYVVKNPMGKVVSGTIPRDEVAPPEIFTPDNLKLIKKRILDYTASQGHTLDLERVELKYKEHRNKIANKIAHAKDLDHLNNLNDPSLKNVLQLDPNNRTMMAFKKEGPNQNPNSNNPEGAIEFASQKHIYSEPDEVLSSPLAQHLLGSEKERKLRLIISTAHKIAGGLIITTFIVWLLASIATVLLPFAVAAGVPFATAAGILSNGVFSNSLAISIGGLLGLNEYCKKKAEQAAYKKEVYEKLTEEVAPGVTRLEKFTELEKNVELKKEKVVDLRNKLKERKVVDEKSLVGHFDVDKIDVYNNYYFEKQKDKPSLTTKIKMMLNRIYQAVAGGESGFLVLRILCLAGGLLTAIFTGAIVPFFICAGVAAAVMGGLQLGKYLLNRNQDHRKEMLSTLKERTDWLAIKEKELDVVINQLEKNTYALDHQNTVKKDRALKFAPYLIENDLDNDPEDIPIALFNKPEKNIIQNQEKPHQLNKKCVTETKAYSSNPMSLHYNKKITNNNSGPRETGNERIEHDDFCKSNCFEMNRF